MHGRLVSVRAASAVWTHFGKEEEGGIAIALLTDDDAAKTRSDGAGHVIRNEPPVQLPTRQSAIDRDSCCRHIRGFFA